MKMIRLKNVCKTLFLSVSMVATSAISLAQATVETFSSAGNATWVVPNGVSSVTIGAWGAGGGGGGTLSAVLPTSNPRAGGGGGGAFSSVTIAVQPGDELSLIIGEGGAGGTGDVDGFAGQWSSVAINGEIVVSAEGGNGGSYRTSGNAIGTASGLGGASGVGFLFAGGNGGTNSSTNAGAGGGGAGGSEANGTDGSNTTHGLGGDLGGGNGGAVTSSNDQNGNDGIIPGGGGGGSIRSGSAGSSTGGRGANGMIVLQFCKIADMPVIENILTDMCQNTVENFSVVADSTVESYTWSLPADWSGASTSNEVAIMAGASSGDVIVAAINECGTSEELIVAMNVTPLPVQPSVISGGATVCADQTITYSVNANSAYENYVWSIPTNWIGESDSNSIEVTVNGAAGQIAVYGENACGVSPTRILNVTVNTVPVVPSAISGETVLCQGSSALFSVANAFDATSYTWSIPADWTGSGTTNTMNLTVGETSGDVVVIANNACGASAPSVLNVTINPISSEVEQDGVVLTAIQEDATYQWINCATGMPIDFATGKSFTATENGEYSVLVITPTNCTIVSDCFVVNSVAIESTVSEQLTVFPNPASGFVTVANAPAGSTVNVMDMTGKVIISTVASSTTTIDLSSVRDGVYFLSIEGKKAVKTQKLVVRK